MLRHASRYLVTTGVAAVAFLLALLLLPSATAVAVGPPQESAAPPGGPTAAAALAHALSPSSGSTSLATGPRGLAQTTAPGAYAPARSMALPPAATPASRSIPGSIFSNPLAVSTTTTGSQNGGPVFAWSGNPSTVSDASGYIWTAWAANVSGRWGIFFAYSSTDGVSFTTPVQLDSGAATQDTAPSLAVHGSGSAAHIAVVWETRAADYYNPASTDGYVLKVSLNGGGSWSQSGTQANWWGSSTYGPMSTVEGPAVAWTYDGYAEVAYWAYFANYGTYTTWPTGTVNVLDAYTGGTTICSGTGCPGAVFEGPRSTTALYWPVVAIGCSATASDCAFSFSVTNAAVTADQVHIWYSTTDFTSLPYDAIQIISAAMSNPYASVLIFQGEVAYGTGSNDSLVTFGINTGSVTSPTFNVDYYYHSGIAYVHGAWPTGSATTTGTRSAYIVGDPSTGAAFVSWVDVNNIVQATWAAAPSGSFLAPQAVVTGGALSATSIGMSRGTSPSPFRVDVVYVDAGNPTSQIYYAGFHALSATAAASPTTVDLWHNVQFSATPSGGASPFTFTWSFGGACSPSCPTTTQNPSVNYTAAGSYTVSVTVTDALAETAVVSVGTITVNARLMVAVAPATSTVDQGASVTFTATPSGGSSVYTAYAWQINGVTQSGATGSTFMATFNTPGTQNVAADVTDSLGYTSPWTGAVVTVNSPLAVGAITVTPAVGVVGQSIGFSGSVSGGTTPYVYSWFLGFGQTSTSATPSYAYPSAGTFTVYLNVTDSANPSGSGSATGLVKIDSPMTVTATSFPASPTAGQTVYLNASVSGGTPGYTFQWVPGDGTAMISGQFATHAYAAPGTFVATLWVNDSLGYSKTATATVIVLSPLTVISATGAPNPTDTATMVTLTATATGGVLPYTYVWNFGDGTPAATGAWVHHNYTAVGSDSVVVTVTDGAGHTARGGFTEVVNSASGGPGNPAVVLTIQPDPANANLPTSFSATVTGGTAPYTSYAWVFGDGTTATTTGPTTTHTYTAAGSVSGSLTVTDSASHQGTAPFTLQIYSSGTFNAQVVAQPSTADVGQTVYLNGSASGGSGTYTTFTFTFGDGQTQVVTPSGSVASATHVYATAGTYQVTVQVLDSAGGTKTSAPTTLLVDPALKVALVASQPSADPGQNVLFTATASGGSQNYYTNAVVWDFGDASAGVSGAASQRHVYAASGTYTVSATFTDTNGARAQGTLSFLVNPPLAAQITANVDNQPAPMSVTFSATISGGSGPYTLIWDFGDGSSPSTGTADSAQHTFSATGPNVYEVTLQINDSVGGMHTAYYNATVAGPTGFGAGGSLAGLPWWLWLAIVAIAVAALALIVVSRRRHRAPAARDLDNGGAAPMIGGAAVAGGVAPDLIAPPVPPGSSDQSPDEMGGVLAPEGAPAAALGDALRALPAPAMGPAEGSPALEGPTPPPSGACPRCGSPLIAEGIACPTCQYLPPPPAATGEMASAAALPAEAGVGPPPAPPLEQLTHCPQCGGPLSPDLACPSCQVRWESAQAEPLSGIGRTAPGIGGSAPPSAEATAPLDLSRCPQCGGPLDDVHACATCQVIWEQAATTPPGPPEDGETARSEMPPAPVVMEVPRSAPATVVPPPSPPADVLPPSAVDRPLPAPGPTPPSPTIDRPFTTTEAPRAREPAPAEPVPAALPSSEPETVPLARCFICNGPVENGYCPNCNMSWADEGRS